MFDIQCKKSYNKFIVQKINPIIKYLEFLSNNKTWRP